MYRSVISFLLLTLLVGTFIAINPRARGEATDLWEETSPTLVDWRDKILEVLQEFLRGEADAQIEQEPVPPELNTDIIITFDHTDGLLCAIGIVSA